MNKQQFLRTFFGIQSIVDYYKCDYGTSSFQICPLLDSPKREKCAKCTKCSRMKPVYSQICTKDTLIIFIAILVALLVSNLAITIVCSNLISAFTAGFVTNAILILYWSYKYDR